MDIVVLNAGNVVAMAAQSLTVDGAGVHGPGWVYPAITSANGSVIHGVTLPDGWAPNAWSYTSSAGWTVIDQAAVDTTQAAALAATITAKLQALNAYCSMLANGGTTVDGFAVETDATTRTDLNGSYALAMADSTYTTVWVPEPGASVTLSAVQIIAIAIAVGKFYGACYSNQGTHGTAIKALTTTDAVNAYDFTTGWPEGT